jgi:flagellar motor switch protein FliM
MDDRQAGNMDGMRASRQRNARQSGDRLAGDGSAARGAPGAVPAAPLDSLRWDAVRRLHETAARGVSESLAQQIHHAVNVRLADLSTVSTARFLLSRRAPTCFAVIAAQPLDCRVLLEIEPAALYALFDWMLGGGREASYPPGRPMTEIEMMMAENIVRWIAAPYAAAWEHVLSLELSLERLEHNPLRLRHFPALVPMVLARWSVRIDSAVGQLLLAVPLSAIALMADKLVGSANTPRLMIPQDGIPDIEPAV